MRGGIRASTVVVERGRVSRWAGIYRMTGGARAKLGGEATTAYHVDVSPWSLGIQNLLAGCCGQRTAREVTRRLQRDTEREVITVVALTFTMLSRSHLVVEYRAHPCLCGEQPQPQQPHNNRNRPFQPKQGTFLPAISLHMNAAMTQIFSQCLPSSKPYQQL